MLHYYAAIFLPLVSFLILGGFILSMGGRFASLISNLCITGAAIASLFVFQEVAIIGDVQNLTLFPWIHVGDFKLDWALRFDTLTAVMLVVVNIVSAVVHFYSVGYMHGDPSKTRFMAYLGLFTFAMLMLVTADNFVQMFFGWEGVGLASYLLIGFWYQKDSANKAAMKAFIVNRVGDFGFALGIMAAFVLFGTVNFTEMFALAPSMADKTLPIFGYSVHAPTLVCLLLFVGAMGKSAQLGLHVWLPDAMEGPTPVSALIHAATMVTAGVFMLARLSPIFELSQTALDVVTIFGAVTAFFAATVALTQNDIKRIIAYSTCSQLGYMFFALGVSAYGAGVFHLFTHAFFKALLFLGAGSVIHALHHEQDIRKMGGIWKVIPITYALMWIGSLGLAGIPPFAGYFSKDMILESAWAAHSSVGTFAFVLGLLSAFMTAFYSWRLIFVVFHGKTTLTKKQMNSVHESPPVMLLPMVVLVIGTVLAGLMGYNLFVGEGSTWFWATSLFTTADHAEVLSHAHHAPFYIKKLPLLLSLSGIGLAYLLYMKRPKLPATIAKRYQPLYQFSLNKWYFDELYNKVFVQPMYRLADWFWQAIDQAVIDRFGPNGAAWVTQFWAKRASRIQTGYVFHYAVGMILGLLALSIWIISRSGVGF